MYACGVAERRLKRKHTWTTNMLGTETMSSPDTTVTSASESTGFLTGVILYPYTSSQKSMRDAYVSSSLSAER